jgi:hypothetical protein
VKFKPSQDRQKARRRSGKPRRTAATTLPAHPVFAPLLGAWGAALVGLSIMVLPAPLMVRASKGTGLVLLGGAAQAVLAIFAALMVGGTMFLFASQLTRRARRQAATPSIVSIATRRVRTIDPSRDLGSLRLDDPIEAEPFASFAPAPVPAVEAADAETPPPPRALDLAEFAQLPGRNAVWVEEPASAPEETAAPPPAPVAAPPAPLVAVAPAAPVAQPRPVLVPQPAPPPVEQPGDAALARLRAAPTEQLSLAEMVERFAGALHEHRETAPTRPMTPQDIAAREAALAEALRALAALSGDNRPAPASEPLADALTRLHGVRGAA